MNMIRMAIAAAGVAALASPAAAFSPLTPSGGGGGFGDTKLSYRNGVVYDDDLVPGRRTNQSFQLGDGADVQLGVQSTGSNRNIRADSPDLIGRDGRIVPGR